MSIVIQGSLDTKFLVVYWIVPWFHLVIKRVIFIILKKTCTTDSFLNCFPSRSYTTCWHKHKKGLQTSKIFYCTWTVGCKNSYVMHRMFYFERYCREFSKIAFHNCRGLIQYKYFMTLKIWLLQWYWCNLYQLSRGISPVLSRGKKILEQISRTKFLRDYSMLRSRLLLAVEKRLEISIPVRNLVLESSSNISLSILNIL